MGQLALEDNDTITIRNLKGEVESYPKSRILQIVKLVDPQPGQQGAVFLRDGHVREGIIIEDDYDHVLIEIEGIRARLLREAVSHVVLQPTTEERYATAKANLQPGMFDAHLAICRWLFDQKRYDLAKKELLDLLSQTEMPEARQLLTLVEAQLRLAARPPACAPQTRPNNAARSDDDDDDPSTKDHHPASGPVYLADMLPDQLVTNDDVNVIRVYEIDFQRPPRLTIKPETIRELIERYGTSKLIPTSQTGRNELFRAAADRPIDVVRLMFELRARDLYPQIQVNSEPASLNLFRQRIHDTWLINTCATNRCHGGPSCGPLFLHRKNYKDDRVRYTNLLILERLKLDPQWPLINYDKPEQSLIIQYGLPRDLAQKPHPKVPGWKEAFRPSNPKMKDDAIEWIRSMMLPRPDYPVKYDPPQMGYPSPAATQPDGLTNPDR